MDDKQLQDYSLNIPEDFLESLDNCNDRDRKRIRKLTTFIIGLTITSDETQTIFRKLSFIQYLDNGLVFKIRVFGNDRAIHMQIKEQK